MNNYIYLVSNNEQRQIPTTTTTTQVRIYSIEKKQDEI